MGRSATRTVIGAGWLALALAGCSPGPAIDRLPEGLGGLPAGVPSRPVAPYQYPAVHDMPATRSAKPLSEEEQVRLEKELQATRDRQVGRESPKAAEAAKKKPPAAKTGQNTGAKTNP